jgi:hypothetical protein
MNFSILQELSQDEGCSFSQHFGKDPSKERPSNPRDFSVDQTKADISFQEFSESSILQERDQPQVYRTLKIPQTSYDKLDSEMKCHICKEVPVNPY